MAVFSPQFPIDFTEPPIKVMLLGEAPGAQEEIEGKPFIGRSGQLMRSILSEIGMPAETIYISNTFWTRPPDNKVDYFFSRKFGNVKICDDLPDCSGMFLKDEWRHESVRLQNELDLLKPKVIIATGRIPLWALTGLDQVSKNVGKFLDVNGIVKYDKKCIVVYHPAYVLRNRNLVDEWRSHFLMIKEYMESDND